MENTKLQAVKILDKWYKLSAYCSDNMFCINHKDFKLIAGNKIFTDKELVIEINNLGSEFFIRNDIKLFDLLSIELKNDKNLVIDLLKTNPSNYTLIRNDLKDDKEVILTAIDKDPKMFRYTSEKIRDNDEIVNFVLDKSPENFAYVSSRFKTDKQFILNLAQKTPSVVSQIDPSLKSDVELLAKIWQSIKENYLHQDIRLFNNTLILYSNIDDTLKPFFESVDPDTHYEIFVDKFDNIFNSLLLNKELSSELNKSNKQEKKIKI